MGPAALIVDDDRAFRDLATLLFSTRGCDEVFAAGDTADALSTFRCRRPDWVLIDVNLNGSSGTVLARALAQQDRPPRIVLTSTDATAVSPEQIDGCGAVGFVVKDQLATIDLAALFSHAGT
jgi:CheY-like chemotaxis protein